MSCNLSVCMPCRRAHSACNGGSPCRRCEMKQTEDSCMYPASAAAASLSVYQQVVANRQPKNRPRKQPQQKRVIHPPQPQNALPSEFLENNLELEQGGSSSWPPTGKSVIDLQHSISDAGRRQATPTEDPAHHQPPKRRKKHDTRKYDSLYAANLNELPADSETMSPSPRCRIGFQELNPVETRGSSSPHSLLSCSGSGTGDLFYTCPSDLLQDWVGVHMPYDSYIDERTLLAWLVLHSSEARLGDADMLER